MKLNLGCIVLGLTVGGAAFAAVSPEIEVVDSIGWIEKPATIAVKSPEDLRTLIRVEQEKYAVLAPPSLSPYWSMIKGDIFVDWFSGEWGTTAKRAFAYLDKNMIPRYEVKIWEDFSSGEIFVVNNRNELMATLNPEKGFDSYGFWLNGQSRVSFVSELSDFERVWYSSSHTALLLTLTPKIFESVCAEIREEEWARAELERAVAMEGMADSLEESGKVVVSMSMASAEPLSEPLVSALSSPPPPPDGGGSDGGGEGGSGTNLEVTLTLSLPEGFGHMHHIEIFAKDDLVYSPSWSLPADGEWIPTYGSQTVVWTDSESTNKTQRFYLVSDGADKDGDGHSDLYEAWEGNTLSNSFDLVNVDGDDLHDWLEWKIFGDLSQTGTDDFDGDGLLNNEELVSVSVDQPAIMFSDPSLCDSDGEGLNDFQERRVWNTDPMDPDTDGDGLDDAAEVLGAVPTDPKNPDTEVPGVVLS